MIILMLYLILLIGSKFFSKGGEGIYANIMCYWVLSRQLQMTIDLFETIWNYWYSNKNQFEYYWMPIDICIKIHFNLDTRCAFSNQN